MQRLTTRLNKELEKLGNQPPAGILCWTTDKAFQLGAQLLGPDNTPYENGVFHLEVILPERYPFEPPKVRFITPVYHPNIDSSGRICLDVLKMPPTGSWKPSLQISSVLTSIQLLLSDPNPDDPLMIEIAEEYKFSRVLYVQHAKEWTEKYAKASDSCKVHLQPNVNSTQELQTTSLSGKRLDVNEQLPPSKRKKVQ